MDNKYYDLIQGVNPIYNNWPCDINKLDTTISAPTPIAPPNPTILSSLPPTMNISNPTPVTYNVPILGEIEKDDIIILLILIFIVSVIYLFAAINRLNSYLSMQIPYYRC